MREKHNIKLDYNSSIFFSIYGAAEDTEFHCINKTLRYNIQNNDNSTLKRSTFAILLVEPKYV